MQRELNIRADYEEVNVSNKDQVKRMPGICQVGVWKSNSLF